MALTGFKGIDVKQTGNQLVFRAFLQTSAGALLTSGTVNFYLTTIQSDGTILTYDFATTGSTPNQFTASTVTTETLAATYRKSNNAATDTGLWTATLSTLTGFTIGQICMVRVNCSGASPTDQMREFQYGSAEGDLVTNAISTGVATVNANAFSWGGTQILSTSLPVGTAAGASGGLVRCGTNAATTFASIVISGSLSIDLFLNLVSGINIGGVQIYPAIASFFGTASAGGANTITLAGGVATDQFYKYSLVQITGGTGAGQSRLIANYVGSTGVATVNKNWTTAPDATSTFSVVPNASPLSIGLGIAQAGSSSTITLNSTASATDNLYAGETIAISSGTGTGQSRVITGYVGSTKVATVNAAWVVNPDSTSVYEISVSGLATLAPTQAFNNTGQTTAIPATDGITGTAQAGSANTITLAAGDTTADGGYVGQSIVLTGGTGKGQAATISGNVSKVAMVVTPYANGNWLVNPDATTTYSISGQLPVLQVGVASIPPVIVSNS